MLPNLNELLEYQNQSVLNRYQKDFTQSKITAKNWFSELLKFIWLSMKHHHEKSHHPENVAFHFTCAIHPEMKEIDDMWHTFLLFTQDYHDFCQRYLNGFFFHHQPLASNEEKISTRQYKKELERYLSYIYENLGEETVLAWFEPARSRNK
jgi:hypothetical protein